MLSFLPCEAKERIFEVICTYALLVLPSRYSGRQTKQVISGLQGEPGTHKNLILPQISIVYWIC